MFNFSQCLQNVHPPFLQICFLQECIGVTFCYLFVHLRVHRVSKFLISSNFFCLQKKPHKKVTEFDDDDDDELYSCVDVFYFIKLLHLILQSHRHFVKNKSMYTASSATRISMDEHQTCNHNNNVNGRTLIFIRIINGSRL